MLYRKFDRYFGTFCLVIGAVGYFVPCIFAAPYFLVVWRMLIGRHMQTNAKLFIGRLIREQATEANSLASSDTTSHWIVAFMCNDSDSYYVAHAVGAVFLDMVKLFRSKKDQENQLKKSIAYTMLVGLHARRGIYTCKQSKRMSQWLPAIAARNLLWI